MDAAVRRSHDHHDAPDTEAAFERMTALQDGPSREVLRERIVCAWLPMASRLARKYRNRGEEFEDLEQVAALGLTKAVERYDPSRGYAFESYAVPVILGEIKRHFRDCTWDIHVPRRVQELRNRVRKSIQELSQTSEGRTPSVAAIAEHSKLSEEEVRQGMEAMQSYSSLSLDAEMSGSTRGYNLLDTLGATETAYQQVVRRETVKPCLRRLPERERRILYLRYYRDMTQSRIADQLGISQMHVSRVLRATCEKVRREVEADMQEASDAPEVESQAAA
jgi:RNA polymerase sigma-B factor